MRHALVLALILTVAACRAPPSAPSPRQTIALDLTHGAPLMHLAIGARAPVYAIFDTGSDLSVIDIAYARRIGLPEQGPDYIGSPLGGPRIEGFRTTIRDVTFEGVRAPAFAATAAPLDLGAPLAIVSPNAFGGKWLTIDFGGSRILLDARGAQPPEGVRSGYDSEGRLPTIAVDIGGRAISAHLDTGSDGGLSLPYAVAASLQFVVPPRKSGRAQSAAAQFDVYSAQLRGDVRVGPLLLRDPEVEFFDADSATANVGMGLLRHLQIVIDPERKAVWTRARTADRTPDQSHRRAN